MHYLKSLYDWLDASTVDRTPIARTAWALLRDSYHGDICLVHPPNVIAVAVLYLALHCYGVTIPYDADAKLSWWQVRKRRRPVFLFYII